MLFSDSLRFFNINDSFRELTKIGMLAYKKTSN